MKLSDVKEIPTERDADQRERMLRGDMYFSADEALVKERHRARRLCRAYNATTEEQGEERTRLLKELLGGTGRGADHRARFHLRLRHLYHGGRKLLRQFRPGGAGHLPGTHRE